MVNREKIDIHAVQGCFVFRKCGYEFEKREFVYMYRRQFKLLQTQIRGKSTTLESESIKNEMRKKRFHKMHHLPAGKTLVKMIRRRFNFSDKTWDWDILNSFYKEFEQRTTS